MPEENLIQHETDSVNHSRKKKTYIIYKLILILLFVWGFRNFVIDSYQITSPSMEGTLLVDDNVFVAKYYYGARVPSAFGIPFIDHDSKNLKAFGISLSTGNLFPYMRLPGFNRIKSNDILAFNFPHASNSLALDFKQVFIKRCAAVAGDTVAIKEGQVFVNNKAITPHPKDFKRYSATSSAIITDEMAWSAGVKDYVNQVRRIKDPLLETFGLNVKTFRYNIDCDLNTFKQLRSAPYIKRIALAPQSKEFNDLDVYPEVNKQASNKYNFPSIVIPQKSKTVTLDTMNSAYYFEVLTKYENQKNLTFEKKLIYKDGLPLKQYTFLNNYYFLLGDNQEISLDSRNWGFVPESHILGKVLTVFYSKDFRGIRWDRMFKNIN